MNWAVYRWQCQVQPQRAGRRTPTRPPRAAGAPGPPQAAPRQPKDVQGAHRRRPHPRAGQLRHRGRPRAGPLPRPPPKFGYDVDQPARARARGLVPLAGDRLRRAAGRAPPSPGRLVSSRTTTSIAESRASTPAAARGQQVGKGPGAGRNAQVVPVDPCRAPGELIGSVIYQTYRKRRVPPTEIAFLEEVHRRMGVLVTNAYAERADPQPGPPPGGAEQHRARHGVDARRGERDHRPSHHAARASAR